MIVRAAVLVGLVGLVQHCSALLQCSEATKVGNCYCSTAHSVAKFELFCPSYSPPSHVLTLQVDPGNYIKITCTPGKSYSDILSNLVNLNIGNVKFLKMINCPVPADPFASLLTTMGVTNTSAVTWLQFSNSPRRAVPPVTEMQGYHFQGLPGLRILELMRNNIKKVDKTFFLGVPGLKRLDLTNNKGIDMDGNSLTELAELQEFSCHSCNLQSLPSGIFAGQARLTSLSLHDNKLTELPPGIFDSLTKLVNLTLNKNNLKSLPLGIFDKLENLARIQISFNRFESFPENLFSKNKMVKSFEMKANGKCPPYFPQCANEITKMSFPATVFQGSSIEVIKMLWVPLRSIPSDLFKNCTALVNVTMQYSFVSELPADLFKYNKNVELIDFSGNSIETLPANIFDGLTKVKSLRFIKSKLTRLEQNQLADLQNLRIIHLQENNIQSLEKNAFSSNRKLEELDLSKNQLRKWGHIPSIFEKLKILNIAQNKLNEIEDAFRFNMLNVKVLNFSYNNIGEGKYGLVPDDLQFLQRSSNLVVDLSYNKIKRLSFENTRLQKSDTFSNYHLNLTGNPLICDCHATELKKMFNGSYSGQFRGMFQLDPKSLYCTDKQKELALVEYEELNCDFPSDFAQLACTDNCSCSFNLAARQSRIDCSGRGLTAFPARLPMIPRQTDSILLNLAGNEIRNLSQAVERFYRQSNSNYANISRLILSGNRIHTFSQQLLPENIAELHLDRKINQTQLKLRLGDNPYSCDCRSASLYSIIVSQYAANILDRDRVRLRCDKAGSEENIYLWKSKLEDFCANSLPGWILGLIFLLVILVVALTLTAFYFYYQETIIIWAYSKPWARQFFEEDLVDREKPYDAFLSYSHEDAEYVEGELLAGLEQPEDPAHKFRCLIHTRDWSVGEMIPDQIMNSVESSRRTVIVLSAAYIDSMWTKLEFRAAHKQALQDKTQRVIVVVRGQLPDKEGMEEDLQKYISLNTYLDTEDPWFWQKLRYALPHRGKRRRARTRQETDRLELMRSQAELELGKQSRTPSPKTLDVKSLLRVETEGNTDLIVSNGVNGHMGNGAANGHHNQMMVCS